MPVSEFVDYCSTLNVKSDARELETYERGCWMLPTARVSFPEQLIRDRFRWKANGRRGAPPAHPAEATLYDPPPWSASDYERLADDDLSDSFDRNFGANSLLSRPNCDSYKPWKSYLTAVTESPHLLVEPFSSEEADSESTIRTFQRLRTMAVGFEHFAKEVLRGGAFKSLYGTLTPLMRDVANLDITTKAMFARHRAALGGSTAQQFVVQLGTVLGDTATSRDDLVARNLLIACLARNLCMHVRAPSEDPLFGQPIGTMAESICRALLDVWRIAESQGVGRGPHIVGSIQPHS